MSQSQKIALYVEIQLGTLYLMVSVVNRSKFLDFLSRDLYLWCDKPLTNEVIILYERIIGMGMKITNADEMLNAIPIEILSSLFTILLRYLHYDKDVKSDFDERREMELRTTQSPNIIFNIENNFASFYSIISASQKHLFGETTAISFGKQRLADDATDLICGSIFKIKNPLYTLNINTQKMLQKKYFEDKKKEEKKKEIDRIAEQELTKALEEAKPVKVSQQQQTKSANKKREQAKREREEFERRSAEAEAERIRQLRKKQQQKQAKKKA